MTEETTHYSYESHVVLPKESSKTHKDEDPQIPINVVIKNIDFMVPVEISFEIINTITQEVVGEELKISGGMNLAKQYVSIDDSKFPPQITEQLKQNTFQFLQQNGNMPQNQYEANDEVYDQAERAQSEHSDLQEQNLGDI
mgnify:CR=1 FL=1